MKITTCSPMIIAKDYKAMVETFTQLGFTATHTKDDVENLDVSATHLKDDNGNHLDIVQANVPSDILMTRINVDDLDEAIKILEANGFKKYTDRVERSGSSIDCHMVSPNGLMVLVSQHLK